MPDGGPVQVDCALLVVISATPVQPSGIPVSMKRQHRPMYSWVWRGRHPCKTKVTPGDAQWPLRRLRLICVTLHTQTKERQCKGLQIGNAATL